MFVALLHLAEVAAAAPLNLHVDPCGAKAADIVVCGSRGNRSPYRRPELNTEYEAKRLRAQAAIIPGVNGRVHVDSVVRPDGLQDNRLMVTFSTAF